MIRKAPERIAEGLPDLVPLVERLLEHIPPRDLGTILFPPTLWSEVLRTAVDRKRASGGGFDPDLPDEPFLEAVLDRMHWLSRHYFDAAVEGAERVPAEGPALIVGNHNAGLMPIDASFAIREIRRTLGPDRPIHALVHDFAYMSPTLARHAHRLGILRASSENARAALEAGRIVMVYPGGDRDAFRPWPERNEIVLAGRTGFARIALESRAPIVPLVSAGLHESFVVLSRGERIARALHLKDLLRTEVLPIALCLPWGIAPAFAPFIPMPTTIDMRMGDPIALEGDPGDEEAVRAGYERVEREMRSIMDDISKRRAERAGGSSDRPGTGAGTPRREGVGR